MKIRYDTKMAGGSSGGEIAKQLQRYGYGDAWQYSEDVFSVERIGIRLPGVSLTEDNRYGSVIRELREKSGMTLAELAGIIMIRPEYLALVENGTGYLTEAELHMLASAFDVSAAQLANGYAVNRISPAITLELAICPRGSGSF